MAGKWTLLRQEAEGLVDYLEEQPERVLHDKTNVEVAAELRELFGMCSREEEQRRKTESAGTAGAPTTIQLNVTCYEEPKDGPFPLPDFDKP